MAGSAGALRLAAGGLAGILLATAGLGLTYNTTPSLPHGVYRIRPLAMAPVRGDIVGFCLTGEPARMALARGYVHPQGLEPLVYGKRCASGAAVIGKPVAGLPGDTIEVTTRGVLVNGRLLRRSRVQRLDRSGRMLPAASRGSGSSAPASSGSSRSSRRTPSTAGSSARSRRTASSTAASS